MLASVLEQLQKTYPQYVRVVFRHFPLPGHEFSLIATQAAEAAGLQGKFWEMHFDIFQEQSVWIAQPIDAFTAWAREKAKRAGIDVEKFSADMKSEAIVKKAQSAQDEAMKIGIPSTPYLLINGRSYVGPRDYDSLLAIVKLLQFTECPKMTIDPARQYTATLKTAKGDIVIKLLPEQAPVTVNNFVVLARNGWYDGLTFHRVLAGFVAQTGDPLGTGGGGPGYMFDNEISTLKYDKAGVVGMANAGADTNGSQFFITYTALPDLNGAYTIFGQVTSGMDVAQKLTPRNPQQGQNLAAGDKITKVIIEEK